MISKPNSPKKIPTQKPKNYLLLLNIYFFLTACTPTANLNPRSEKANQINTHDLHTIESQEKAINKLFLLFREECKSQNPSQETLHTIRLNLQKVFQEIKSQNQEAVTHLPICK